MSYLLKATIFFWGGGGLSKSFSGEGGWVVVALLQVGLRGSPSTAGTLVCHEVSRLYIIMSCIRVLLLVVVHFCAP